VPKATFAALLEAAHRPPAEALTLPFTADQPELARLFVSVLLRPVVCPATPLGELKAIAQCDAVVTRVRRGDVDLVPDEHFVLQPGDRARVLAPTDRMSRVQKLFGDSLQHVSEIDVITFSLGITLGLLVGAVPVPLPGGGHFALGVAGGPLLVGLVLGRLGRSGPLVWSSPFGANLTLRQLGLVLFLAGVGVRAGRSFADALATRDLVSLGLAGALISTRGEVAGMVAMRYLLYEMTDELERKVDNLEGFIMADAPGG